MGSSEQENQDYCANCGKPTGRRLVDNLYNSPICADCTDRFVSGQTIRTRPLVEKEEPLSIEQRFGELFRAARVLFREGVDEETQIIPTLALANEIGQGAPDLIDAKERLVAAWEDPEAWEAEAKQFTREHASLRPVKAVEGILILEQLPVSVRVYNYPDKEGEPPEQVVVTVYPYRARTSPEGVAATYEKTLSEAGIPCEESQRGFMGFEFSNEGYLLIGIERSDVSLAQKRARRTRRRQKSGFPHPLVVGEYYKMLLGTPAGHGFARYLVTRKRGRDPDADNLVPACVAFYLREYGEMGSRKEIHRLLNEHLLRETWKTSLPQQGYSTSGTTQLWRDVDKVKARLLAAAYALYF